MMATRIVKFYPRCFGGVIALPKVFTTIAGFDFDIDVLYLIKCGFKEMKHRDISNKEVWERVWELHQDIHDMLADRRDAHKTDWIANQVTLYQQDPSNSNVPINRLHKKAEIAYNALYPDLIDIWYDVLSPEEYKNHRMLRKEDYYKEAYDVIVREKGLPRFVGYNDNKGISEKQDPMVLSNIALFYAFDTLMSPETLNERFSPGGAYTIGQTLPAARLLHSGNLDGINTVEELWEIKEVPDELENPADPMCFSYHQTNNNVYAHMVPKAAIQNMSQKIIETFAEFRFRGAPLMFGTMFDRAGQNNVLIGVDVVSRYKDKDLTDSALLLAELLTSALDGVKNGDAENYGIVDSKERS